MSYSKIKNSNNENIGNIDKEKNNSINSFSSNFNQYLNKYKYSKKSNDNKNNNINNNSQNNKNINSQNTNSNALLEFEFIYNDFSGGPKKNKNANLKHKANTNKTSNYQGTTNKNINKQNLNISYKYPTNKIKLNNAFNSPMNKTLTTKLQLYQNKYKSRQPLEKNKSKRNISQKNNFEIFLQNVKERQIKKEKNINELRNKTLKKERSEILSHPKILQKSSLLLKNIKRQPLYQRIPLNEESKLDKNFGIFYFKNYYDRNRNNNNTINYNNNTKDNRNNSFIIKSPFNNKTIEEKYNKFYENNLKWKKEIEKKNDNKRDNKNNENEKYFGSNYSFKPLLDKKSIKIIDKKRNKSIDYDINNNIYNAKNGKELYDKFKIRLKPIISDYYGNNRPYLNKKKDLLNRALSDNNLRKKIYHNFNYKSNKEIKNKNYKMNYKKNETKYKKLKKEEKKNLTEGKINKKKKDMKNKGKDYYLLLKIKELQKEKEEKKKKELYKLNIRQGTSWNLEAINNVIPRHKCGHIIEGLL